MKELEGFHQEHDESERVDAEEACNDAQGSIGYLSWHKGIITKERVGRKNWVLKKEWVIEKE